MMEEQVVSKERVTNHGEVYTSKREVNAMLDLVKQEAGNRPIGCNKQSVIQLLT